MKTGGVDKREGDGVERRDGGRVRNSGRGEAGAGRKRPEGLSSEGGAGITGPSQP